MGILIRALLVWLMLIAAEILHGIVRGLLLVPHMGEFRSNQLGVFSGSLIILAIAYALIRWIGARRVMQLMMIGLLWLVLTVSFEILFGRLVVGVSWQRLASDYDVLHGGLLPFGMLVLLLSPLIAARLRLARGRGSRTLV